MAKRKIGFGLVLPVVLLVGYSYWALSRNLPDLKPQSASHSLSTTAPAGQLTWPKAGQSAVGVMGTNILQTHGSQKPVPTASTAKLITALAVLREKPLALGQTGPTLTLTASDAALYQKYLAHNGSVVRVVAGEKITEYQALQAMLLPSANNLADSLAIWAYGSLDTYAKAANSYLALLNLSSTHVGKDASGFDPTTTSTAADLVRIGELVMQNPVLAQIVGQKSASSIPVVGTIKNVNFLLGSNGIVGIKTGNSDQAGGVYVSAAKVSVNGQPQIVVTANAAAPNLYDAVAGSLPMIKSAETNFKLVTVVKKNAVVGAYKLPWGGSVSAIANSDLKLQAWADSQVSASISLHIISPNAKANQIVGSISVDNKSIKLKLSDSVPKPSAWWRLTHPFYIN